MPLIAEWREHIPALTTDQMREVDRVMVTEIGISLIQMMENAGRHLAVLAREMCGGRVESKKIVVLAGRGNNGGGGLVAGRRLANWGADVTIITADPTENYTDVPQMQLNILRKMGVPISTAVDGLALLSKADLILDALIGYGLRGAPKNATADLIRAANASGVKILALDAPSGLETSTGQVLNPCIRANATLTLALPKVGLMNQDARTVVGDLYVADISVPPAVYVKMGIAAPNLYAEAEIVRVVTH